MFEIVAVLALAPFALMTLIVSGLVFVFVMLWTAHKMQGVALFAVVCVLGLAAAILHADPVLAAEIYAYLFR